MSELSDEQIETELSRRHAAPERVARALLERARKAEAENRRLIAERAANEKANIESRRSICEQSDRYKAERDVLAAKLQAVEAIIRRRVTDDGLHDRLLAVLSADTTPEATERRCNYNVGDDKPCRCLLPHGHAGLHQCEHPRERSR